MALVAWLAMLIAPVAAQAMMRIDTGVPGAVICSVNKSGDTGDQKAAMPHCQLCTLAQQAVDVPDLAADAPAPQAIDMAQDSRPSDAPPARAPPRAHPPRAPPLS